MGSKVGGVGLDADRDNTGFDEIRWVVWLSRSASPLLTFLTVLSYFGLHEVARTLEDPFTHPPNDLPALHSACARPSRPTRAGARSPHRRTPSTPPHTEHTAAHRAHPPGTPPCTPGVPYVDDLPGVRITRAAVQQEFNNRLLDSWDAAGAAMAGELQPDLSDLVHSHLERRREASADHEATARSRGASLWQSAAMKLLKPSRPNRFWDASTPTGTMLQSSQWGGGKAQGQRVSASAPSSPGSSARLEERSAPPVRMVHSLELT